MILLLYFFTNPSLSADNLHCDRKNYPEYIWNSDKTDILIEQTGKGCQLEKVYLTDQHLRWAYFVKANLRRATIRGKDISYAKFDNANLRDSVFINVKSNNTSFCGADLRDSKFSVRENIMHFPVFDNTDMRGADLSDIYYTTPSFSGFRFNDSIKITIPKNHLKIEESRFGRNCIADE